MPGLLLADQAFERQAAPNIGLRANRAHPSANGLLALYAPQAGGDTVRNLVGTGDLTRAGSPSWSPTAWGLAPWYPAPTTDAHKLTIGTSHPLSLQPPLSIMWVGRHYAQPGASAGLFGVNYTTTDSPPYLCYQIGTSGGAGRDPIFQYNNAGTYAAVAASAASTVGDHVYIATVKAGEIVLYVDGKQAGTSSSTISINYSASSELTFAYYGGTGRTANSLHALGAIWNRCLSSAEVAVLSAKPMSLVQAPSISRFLFLDASAATNPTGSAAVTLAAFTSSASGTETLTGSAAITLAAFTSSASGTESFTGTSATTLANFTGSATGTMAQSVTGTAAITLDSFTSTAVGVAPTVLDTVSHDVRTGQPDPRWRDRRRATWPPPLKTRGSNYGRY